MLVPFVSGTATLSANASRVFKTAAQNVSLTATVTSINGPVNEGSVLFTVSRNGTTVGSPTNSVTVANGNVGIAFVIPGSTPAGDYTVTATYSGATTFGASIDASHTITILPADSTTAASDASVSFGSLDQLIPLSAAITSPSGSVDEGTVTFQLLDGATPIGSAAVSTTIAGGTGGAMYLLPAGTPPGQYKISASFTAPDLTPSSDATRTLTVIAAGTSTSGTPASTAFSVSTQSVQLSAVVSSPDRGR